MGASGSAQIGPDNYRQFGIFAYCPMKLEKKDVAIRIMNEEVKNLENTCDADKLAKCKSLWQSVSATAEEQRLLA